MSVHRHVCVAKPVLKIVFPFPFCFFNVCIEKKNPFSISETCSSEQMFQLRFSKADKWQVKKIKLTQARQV